jgi:3-hydroxyisobutyrate dehydrogenase-like beta-hydroxyacid dehydrogenase
MRIGFIGAGLMGHGMALGLLKAGHEVSVIAHRNRAPILDLVSKGAVEAASVEVIVQGSECIILCLPNSKVVMETMSTLKPFLKSGQIIVDTGTSDPEFTSKIANELRATGVAYADAPLTGGPEQAAKCQLGVLCGASPETYAAIEPLLLSFASTVRHMGPVGTGHAAKLISNYLVTGMIALVSEAFSAARETGIGWRNLYEAMLNGSGNSGVLRKMVEPALADDFDGYKFTLDNAFKDIGYFKQIMLQRKVESGLADAVEGVFAKAVADGMGPQNVSQLLKSR